MHYTADNASIIYARHAMRPLEIGFDPFELGLAEPVMIRLGRVFLKHNFSKDGISRPGMTEKRDKAVVRFTIRLISSGVGIIIHRIIIWKLRLCQSAMFSWR